MLLLLDVEVCPRGLDPLSHDQPVVPGLTFEEEAMQRSAVNDEAEFNGCVCVCVVYISFTRTLDLRILALGTGCMVTSS